jgi:hypothetical protein
MRLTSAIRFSSIPAAALLLMGLAGLMAGCGSPGTPGETAKPAEQAPAQGSAAPQTAEDAPLPPPEYESALPEGVRAMLGKAFTGDLDEMVARRMVRVGVTFNRTFYFVDKGVQRGMAYEFG